TWPTPPNPGPAWWQDPRQPPDFNNWTMAHTKLKVLQCPADNLNNFTYTSVNGNPPGPMVAPHIQINFECTIRAYYYPNARDHGLGLTNYIGVAGSRGQGVRAGQPSIDPRWAKYAGLLDNRTSIALGNIADGSSNTLLFGEGLGLVSDRGRQYAWTWMS